MPSSAKKRKTTGHQAPDLKFALQSRDLQKVKINRFSLYLLGFICIFECLQITAIVKANPATASELLLQQSHDLECQAATTAPAGSSHEVEVAPKFCKCGQCVAMPTKEENVCCRKGLTHGACVLHQENELNMATVVLDENVVKTAVSAARDLYADQIYTQYDNNRMRFQAYNQYVLATAGHIGSGNRIVVPACVVSFDTHSHRPNLVYRLHN